MKENELKELLYDAIIRSVKRTCNIIMIDIICSNKVELRLHSECFVKVIKDNKTIASSNDIYVPGSNVKRRKFRWDKLGMSLFDESIKKNEDLICSTIKNIRFENNELKLDLINNLTIEIIPDTVEDREAYSFFTKDETYFSYDSP